MEFVIAVQCCTSWYRLDIAPQADQVVLALYVQGKRSWSGFLSAFCPRGGEMKLLEGGASTYLCAKQSNRHRTGSHRCARTNIFST